MRAHRPLILLIVDDDPQLRVLLTAAAKRSGRFGAVQTAADGQAAIDYLRRTFTEAPERMPDFILSDLSMPRMDGLDLMHALNASAAFREIPVAVMTSSNRPNDRANATAAGCCAFFHKPTRLEEMTTLIGSLPQICGRDAPVTSPRGHTG